MHAVVCVPECWCIDVARGSLPWHGACSLSAIRAAVHAVRVRPGCCDGRAHRGASVRSPQPQHRVGLLLPFQRHSLPQCRAAPLVHGAARARTDRRTRWRELERGDSTPLCLTHPHGTGRAGLIFAHPLVHLYLSLLCVRSAVSALSPCSRCVFCCATQTEFQRVFCATTYIYIFFRARLVTVAPPPPLRA